ncbi:MAG TPA: lamin tail domain-containing protein, partial [Ohtaekwangia sp.]|uniref:lamin tail domain-containing protein n=1 Tax=Ohtaekwangia sp. TaxID=2066019 RepID=UPI002F94E042
VTEIFADPSPRVELPEVEFIELLNRSNTTYNLSGWTLSDGSSTATFPSYNLEPGKYILLTGTSSTSSYSNLQNVLGLNSFPSWNNTGDNVLLKYRGGITIDSVQYTDSWYKNDDKKSGGWSLELIDPNNICGEENNWAASEDENGGTPGRQNSIYANKPDLTGPMLLGGTPLNDQQIILQFDEKLAKEIPTLTHLHIDPNIPVEKIEFTDQSLRAYRVSLSTPLQAKQLYTISLSDVYDCSGNDIQLKYNSVSLALPEQPDSLDVAINEILFNPKPTGEDFLEIVNTSDKYLNLKRWKVASLKDGVIDKSYTITETDFLLRPDAYLVLVKDLDILIGEYPQTKTENVLEVKALPSWSDDEGNVAILDDQGNTIDYFVYTKNMHSPFIKDDEGVSLERISFTEATNDINNWKSASTTSGYATPGFINSNAITSSIASAEEVIVSPEVFVPLNGNPDFTEIQYKFDQGGYIANVKVLDSNGQLIRQLANNQLLGSEGFLRWDGDRDDGSRARVGYYMVWFQVFNSSGAIKTYRKRLAVAARF